jgi:response regulator NasT
VVIDTRLPDGGGVELALALCRDRPVPVVLVAAEPDAGAVWGAAECHVLGYVAKPLRPEALGAAIAVAARSGERLRLLADEAEQLRQRLAERKVVERAKGAVMRYSGVTEEDAYRRLRRLATARGQKLIDVAQAVLAAGELFGQPEPFTHLDRRP